VVHLISLGNWTVCKHLLEALTTAIKIRTRPSDSGWVASWKPNGPSEDQDVEFSRNTLSAFPAYPLSLRPSNRVVDTGFGIDQEGANCPKEQVKKKFYLTCLDRYQISHSRTIHISS
jgi:hypothetical protein